MDSAWRRDNEVADSLTNRGDLEAAVSEHGGRKSHPLAFEDLADVSIRGSKNHRVQVGIQECLEVVPLL